MCVCVHYTESALVGATCSLGVGLVEVAVGQPGAENGKRQEEGVVCLDLPVVQKKRGKRVRLRTEVGSDDRTDFGVLVLLGVAPAS